MIKSVSDMVAAAKMKCRLLTPEEAADFVRGTDGALVLDVREPGEAAEGSVRGSVNIPRGVLEMKIEKAVPSPSTPLVVHCARGGRASLAASTLQDMGYTNVSVIDGAFEDIAEAFK
ncbi:MAG: rhodanese-like domain-containing protein [Thermodesulfobacteriota bacterium]